MCVISGVYDFYIDRWRWPNYPMPPTYLPQIPSQEDVDNFIQAAKLAKEIDDLLKQPDCESDKKKEVLQDIADRLGVDITFPDEKPKE